MDAAPHGPAPGPASGAVDGPVVVLGAGQAGFQVALSLREGGHAGPVTLVGDEPHPPYQRPPLSKAFLADADAEPPLLRPPAFFAARDIALRLGDPAVRIDRDARLVRLRSGASLPYAALVLALGSRARRLDVPGAALPGVAYLRDLADAASLRTRLAAARRVVVVGAGFVGLEFAAVARARGLAVTVVEAGPRALGRAVSAPVSAHVAAHHASLGTELLFGAALSRVLGTQAAEGVALADGRTLPADLVLVGIGAVPNAELAAACGLPAAEGIAVDEHLLTADPLVSAIGDCAHYPSHHAGLRLRLESVQNATDQARSVAARLCGRPAPYASLPWFWSDQGTLKLQIVGLTAGADQVVLRGTPAEGRFTAFCFRNGRLLGAESVNAPADHMALRRLLAVGRTVTATQAADPALDLRALARD